MEGSCVTVRVQEIPGVENDPLKQAFKLPGYRIAESAERRHDMRQYKALINLNDSRASLKRAISAAVRVTPWTISPETGGAITSVRTVSMPHLPRHVLQG